MTRHRGDIQGIRAIAVLVVALNHAGVGFLRGGYIGVDVFFVVSGYLITGILLRSAQRDGRVSIGDFYVRRARRILPASTLTLVATAVGSYYLLNIVRGKQALTDVLWASFFAENVRATSTATNYFAQGAPPSPVQHFWSLAVEEQFYIVWPTMIALVVFGWGAVRLARRRRAPRSPMTETARVRLFIVIVAIVAGSLLWSIHQTQTDPNIAYFSTFTRAWELGLGAMLAIAAPHLPSLSAGVRTIMGWAGLGAVATAAVTFGPDTPVPGWAALMPTVGAAMLIAAGIARAEPRAGVSRFLSARPMQYIGDRSYTLYLWHWPILVLIDERYGPLSTASKVMLVVAAFALSIVTYRYYENPLHRGERWQGQNGFSERALWFCIPLAVLFVVALYDGRIDGKVASAVAASADGSAPGLVIGQPVGSATRETRQAVASIDNAVRTEAPLPAVIAASRAAERNAPVPVSLTPSPVTDAKFADDIYVLPSGCDLSAESAQTSSRICRLGDPTARKTMVVFGDSHAQMWMGTILDMATRAGWTVIPLLHSQCTVWMAGGYAGGGDTSPPAGCLPWFKWAVKEDLKLHPTLTLLSNYYQNPTGVPRFFGTFEQELKAVIEAFRGGSQKVVVMGDVFGQVQAPVDCLLSARANLGTCSSPFGEAPIAMNNAVRDLAANGGAGFINTEGWLCALDKCPMVVGNTPTYFDTGHITQEYAAQMAVPFRDAFTRASAVAKN